MNEVCDAMARSGVPNHSSEPTSRAMRDRRILAREVERLQALLYRCWPSVWDWDYSPHTRTSINTHQLLDDMDEFMSPEADRPRDRIGIVAVRTVHGAADVSRALDGEAGKLARIASCGFESRRGF